MDLQFDKNEIQCLQLLTREVQSQEQTQEIKLADGMPDIGRVVASWGQAIVRSKEWRSGGMHVSGGIMAWVLYVPEGGGVPQSVETWLPFQIKWDLPETERDGTICAMPLIRSVDARCLSARKMMLRASICVLGEAVIPQSFELYNAGELPADVQILKKNYRLQLPKEAGEKSFSLDVDVSLPASAPPLDKLIGYNLRTELRETKLVGDKLVFRGVAIIHLRYFSTANQITAWDIEVPFSQYAELSAEYHENAYVKICFATVGLELEQSQEENLTLKAGLIGQYIIYDFCDIEVVEDAYSPHRKVKGEIAMLRLPGILEVHTEQVDVEKDMQIELVRVADATLCPDHPRAHYDVQNNTAEICGAMQIVGYDPEGELQSAVSRWEKEIELRCPAERTGEIVLQQTGDVTTEINGDRVNVHSQMQIIVSTMQESEIPMLTAISVGEEKMVDIDRPSVVLCKADTASLWELAKRFGSTTEAIRAANNLEKDPEKSQILLIPIT